MSDRPGVIVTGGAKRIGAAIARHFARHGYDVALHYHRSGGDALMVKNEIDALGVACLIFDHDLADSAGLGGFMQKIHDAMPHCSVLVNNASIFEQAGLTETEEALFDRQFNINFKAPFFLTQAFAKYFRTGSIINILDTDIAQVNIEHFSYLLSKKALASFTPMAARALGPDVRVNGICPGYVLPHSEPDAAYIEKVGTMLPLNGHATVDAVAEAVFWLSRQEHITGQIIYIDGGKHVL